MSSFFGFNESNYLVHVNEVSRGLACQCRCVTCDEPLVARQGEKREHHFAHASNREPCESNHESLLHRYAKQLIVQASGLVAPMTPAVAHYFGFTDTLSPSILQALLPANEEVAMGSIRPDILLVTTDGVQVAIEIAYSSFCDLVKAAEFERLNLPALEIDLSRFTPDNFDPVLVKDAVIASTEMKTWVWPVIPPTFSQNIDQPDSPLPTVRQFLPEEIITISGRWVSIRQFPSGDIAVKVVKFDPDLVSLVRSVAKPHGGRYNPQYRTWNVPRWAARTVRQILVDRAKTMEISMGFVARQAD